MAALNSPGPSEAVIAMARIIGGIDMVTSTSRISAEDARPRTNPASAPSAVPMSAEATTTATAIGRPCRAP